MFASRSNVLFNAVSQRVRDLLLAEVKIDEVGRLEMVQVGVCEEDT